MADLRVSVDPETSRATPQTVGGTLCDARRPRWRRFLPVIAFAVLWADLIRQLSYVWVTNEQYAYGWFVPIFALGLLWRRWSNRPTSSNPGSRVIDGLAICGAGALLPLRVLYEINFDWPLVSWPYTLLVVGLTLYAFYLAGGWRWVKHFAFPVCFILVAVRWPWPVENLITQGLMRLNTSVTVELLGWLNIPAYQHGNLIELATGTVGVDEACSGIRSFQSTLTAALLFGELYLLGLRARAGLVIAGVCFAFTFNVVRTLMLSYQANEHGMTALEQWHDAAGFSVTVASFLVLWLTANVAKMRAGMHSNAMAPVQNFESPPVLQTLRKEAARRFLLACGCWSLLCILATEAWYRDREASALDFARWSVNLPETDPTFRNVDLTPRMVRRLNFDTGFAAQWRENGPIWTIYFFRWEGKSMHSIMSARYHRPDVCLPDAGVPQVSRPQLQYFKAGGLELPFTIATYGTRARELCVFHCVWQDGDEQRKGVRAENRTDRLLMAMEGRRSISQQALMIVTSGYASVAQAEPAVRERLPSLIRIEARTTPALSRKTGD